MADKQMRPNEPWTPGKCYQWRGQDTDGGWWELDEALHADKYMVALPDMLKNLPNGYFGNLFCMLLIAQEVFAEQISGLNIILKEMTNAYGQPKKGSIRSAEFESGVKGFRFSYDGVIEAVKAIFRDITILGNSTFNGDITSGSLISSNQDVPAIPPITFTANQTARDVFDRFGNGIVPIQNGSFGSQDGVIGLRCYMDRISVDTGIGLGSVYDRYNVDIQIIDQPIITRRWYDYSGGRGTLGSALILNGGRGGKTFILNNIPANGGNGVGIGQLYTDPLNNILRIKR